MTTGIYETTLEAVPGQRLEVITDNDTVDLEIIEYLKINAEGRAHPCLRWSRHVSASKRTPVGLILGAKGGASAWGAIPRPVGRTSSGRC